MDDSVAKRRSAYSEKLRDPRWQKARLLVLERDGWACQLCFNTEATLHVHHKYYQPNVEPWDYPSEALVTLCEVCHDDETESRPEAERALLFELRRLGFFSGDVLCLGEAFSRMTLPHQQDVVMSAIIHGISTPEALGKLIDEYFTSLKSRHARSTDGG